MSCKSTTRAVICAATMVFKTFLGRNLPSFVLMLTDPLTTKYHFQGGQSRADVDGPTLILCPG